MKIDKISLDKITANFESTPVTIKSALCIGPGLNPNGNNMFNNSIKEILMDENDVIAEGKPVRLKNDYLCQCVFNDKPDIRWQSIDMTDFNTEVNFLERPDYHMFLVANVRCNQSKQVVLGVGRYNSMAVWVNQKLIYRGYMTFNDSQFIFLELQKGDNLFFIDYRAEVYPSGSTASSLYLRLTEYQPNAPSNITNTNSVIRKAALNRIYMVSGSNHNTRYTVNVGTDEFIVFSWDLINLDRDVPITVEVKNDQDEPCACIVTKLYEPISLDLNQIQGKLKNSALLHINISTRNRAGNEVHFKEVVGIVPNIFHELNTLQEKYLQIKNRETLNESDQLNIEGRLINFPGTEDIVEIERYNNNYPPSLKEQDYFHWSCWGTNFLNIFSPETERNEIRDLLHLYEQGKHFDDFVLKHTPCKVYFKSRLDDKYEHYHISLPESYSPDKLWPLVIVLPWERYEGSLHAHQEIAQKGAIILEIQTRGITMGGCIGEAAFLDVLQMIQQKYRVDQDRIYLIGASAGAYSVWALAQSYPDRFAAIVILSGVPYHANLKNLANIPVLNIVGDNDFLKVQGHDIPAKMLAKYRNMTGIVLQNTGHPSVVGFYPYNSSVIEWLLQHRRNEYPRKIHFRTERLRWNKAYWLEVQGIDEGKMFCDVEAKVVSNSKIHLKLENVHQIELTLPEYLKTDKLKIRVNDQSVNLKNPIINRKLVLRKDSCAFHSESGEATQVVVQKSCRMSILDIYSERMKIVLPSLFNDTFERECLENTAKAFSRPMCATRDPILRVQYPIVTDKQLTVSDIQECNMVLLDVDGNNHCLQAFKDKLPLIYDHSGYVYNKKRTESDYCLMFIVPSPNITGKKMLVVTTNNVTLLKRNRFTTKIVMPIFIEGRHPILDNQLVVFDGIEYKVAINLGLELSKPLSLFPPRLASGYL